MASSSSSNSNSLKALVAFRNLLHSARIRTVHVYQLEGGAEAEVEREYVFHEDNDYEEIGFCKVLTLPKFSVEGVVNGIWECIFVFDVQRHFPPHLDTIPTILSISRNPKLAAIPSLANDLRIISQLSSTVENRELTQFPTEEASEGINGVHQLEGTPHTCDLDLNYLPSLKSENEESDLSVPGVVERKKKRASTEDIAKISFEDVEKYFSIPIAEASKNLNVGLSVLKKKCRELGIPRWPHRKIKSLDSLIYDLQEEAERQQADKAAAMVIAKRQRMIEREKESIERNPFMDIQGETKKFRQNIFVKKHRARVIEGRRQTLSLF